MPESASAANAFSTRHAARAPPALPAVARRAGQSGFILGLCVYALIFESILTPVVHSRAYNPTSNTSIIANTVISVGIRSPENREKKTNIKKERRKMISILLIVARNALKLCLIALTSF